MRVHLDTDFLVFALSASGPERQRLLELAESDAEIEMSAVAWYEFTRGPRTPEQLAVGRSFFPNDGIIPLSEELAARDPERIRSDLLQSPGDSAGGLTPGGRAPVEADHGAGSS